MSGPAALARVSLAAGGAGILTACAATAGVLPPAEALLISTIALVVAAGSLGTASARPALQAFGPALTRGQHPGRLALTFDDGPLPDSTPGILAALADAEATATFFVLADRAERAPGLIRNILEAGHEIQLHGARHDPWLTALPPAAGARLLREACTKLHTLGVPPIRWFRPPFGAVSPRLFASAAAAGLEVAWCSVRTGDGGPASPARIRARCASAVGTDIVLLHDDGRHTLAVLPEALREWRARGITPTTLAATLPPRSSGVGQPLGAR